MKRRQIVLVIQSRAVGSSVESMDCGLSHHKSDYGSVNQANMLGAQLSRKGKRLECLLGIRLRTIKIFSTTCTSDIKARISETASTGLFRHVLRH